MKLATKARTYLALGLGNIARVATYRIGVKSGLGRARRVRASFVPGPFFLATPPRAGVPSPSAEWRDAAVYFGCRIERLPAGQPPDWFFNPYSGRTLAAPERPWWEIPDFDRDFGDIKIVWEPSRFTFVIAAAQRAAAGDESGWEQLETWIADWCRANPPYRGPNWKCGQEAAIRVIHLAVAALILKAERQPTPALVALVAAHLMRIEPTVEYAIGQDNNHGTSEAAALFIGGSWLRMAGDARGARWEALGRRLMANRIERLIAADGSFSQHSLTYHRLMLDTMIAAEAWRRRNELPALPAPMGDRLGRAARWLFEMTASGGDGPNLGSNDGAHLLQLAPGGYRDFRPTVQAAMALFCDARAIADTGPWDDVLTWLGLPAPETSAPGPGSAWFDAGGYTILRRGKAFALLRYPRFRFRPAQADALHLDLWVGADNLLRDSGTFSYSGDIRTLDRFAGTAGHNTIMFDDREQMPRLGRFLYGDWLKAEDVTFDAAAGTASAAYTDGGGARHSRTLRLEDDRLHVVDTLAGRFSRATLRWHLAPGPWRLEGDGVTDGRHQIKVESSAGIARLALLEAEQSLYYLERHKIPVLEVEVRQSGCLTSEIIWS